MTPKMAFFIASYENKGSSKLENIISTDANYSYLYALHVIKGKWRKGENAIITSPYYSYLYALYIVKGKWIKGEEVISNNPEWSYHYAKDIKKGRFKKGEKSIIKNQKCSYWYITHVVKKPLSQFNTIIFNSEFLQGYIQFLKHNNYNINKFSEYMI
jgi:hypothetical protein